MKDRWRFGSLPDKGEEMTRRFLTRQNLKGYPKRFILKGPKRFSIGCIVTIDKNFLLLLFFYCFRLICDNRYLACKSWKTVFSMLLVKDWCLFLIQWDWSCLVAFLSSGAEIDFIILNNVSLSKVLVLGFKVWFRYPVFVSWCALSLPTSVCRCRLLLLFLLNHDKYCINACSYIRNSSVSTSINNYTICVHCSIYIYI